MGTDPSQEIEFPPSTIQPTQVSPALTATPFSTIGPISTETQPTNLPPTPEAHIVQVEWPPKIRLGESDNIRLILVPASQGYFLVTVYPEHHVVTQTVNIIAHRWQ